MDFKDLPQVRKGDFGEKIVDQYLEKKGLIIYKPCTDIAHGFDRLVSRGKEKLIIVEVKTKAKRNAFPDTGINYTHFIGYKKISEKHGIPLYVFFVDEMLGQIYGQELKELEKPFSVEYNGKNLNYPLIQSYHTTKIIYFYQPNMKVIHLLTEQEIKVLKETSTRSHGYEQ